ncbi:MAG: hypothetical protein ACPL1Y_06245, partial [Thermoplasmata archaeon]
LCTAGSIMCGGTRAESKLPETKDTTARTVLAECFTGTWCPYCPGAEGALNTLANEMNRTTLAIIEWHIGDGYETPDGSGQNRADFYGVPGYPTTFFDGLNPTIGGSTNPNDNTVYNDYKTKINERVGIPANFSISISGYINGNYGIVNAEITALNPPPSSTNGTWVHFVICEDKNRSVISGGRTYWLRFDAVKSLGTDLLNIGTGQTLSLQKNFTIEGTWETDRLWIVVFVQNHDRSYNGGTYPYYSAEVYQSATLNISAQPVPEHYGSWLIILVPMSLLIALIPQKQRKFLS